MKKWTALLVLLSASALLTAARAEPVAVINGEIHTMRPAGVIKGGTVIFDNGVITAVGAGLAPPAGAKVIDAKGGIVTPGLMDSLTFLGLREVSAEQTTDDTTAAKAEFSAAFDVSYGINPDSAVIPVTRMHGITRAITAPVTSKTVFAGQAAAISLGEGSSFWVRPGIAMFVSLDGAGARIAGGARGASWVFLREVMNDVQFYRDNRKAFDKAEARATVLPRVDLEALIPVIEGRMPLVMEAYRESDIRQVIAFAGAYKLRVILLGGAEAWKVAPELARAGIPVIADPRDNLPTSFETLGASLDNVPRLQKANVKVAIATMGGALDQRYRSLRQFAGIAVANGLPYDEALAAITRVPAEIWGMSANYGALEKGKDADIVVWSGDPLEFTSMPTAVFIRGQAQDLTSRQTELRDRYRDVKNAPPTGYVPR
ncbi:MAG: amidohydrolase family protein [Rhodospirillaceae bacterium]|nr:amidohydrolase family protein [Rhodospirillaceae bacterium]